MDSNIKSREMVFAIIDEIGLDIDYVRHKGGASANRQYFTGIEMAILFGSGALASFLVGAAKGILQEFGKEFAKGIVGGVGKAAGDKIGQALIKRLEGIVNRVIRSTPASAEAAQDEGAEIQKELDLVIKTDFADLVSTTSAVMENQAVTEWSVSEVTTYLMKSGLGKEMATGHSERVVKVLITKIKS